MKCDDVRRLLGPFLDSELDGRSSYEIALHLEGCETCRDRVERERALEQELAGVVRADGTTPEMWDCALDRLRPKRRWWPWAAAGLVVLSLAATLAWRSQRIALLDAALADHEEFLQGKFGPDVATDDSAQASQFLQQRLSVGASLPASSAEVELVGVRRCFFQEAAVGLAMYRIQGLPASMFLVPKEVLARFTDTGDLPQVSRRGGQVVIAVTARGGEFALVVVGPQERQEGIERLAREVASR